MTSPKPEFYCQTVDVPDYDVLLGEIRPYVLDLVDKHHLQYFCFLNPTAFLAACPKTAALFKSWGLTFRLLATFVSAPNTVEVIHSDTPIQNRLALNFDVYNCRQTYVNVYETSAEPIYINPLPTYYREYAAADCQYVTRYEMTHPVVFNTSKPHQICNLTPLRRVSLTCRFHEPLDFLLNR